MTKRFNFVPIKRVDVYQTVIDRIRSMIADNNLKPGDRLPSERELAEKLGVSRASIRQAIKALETLGEVEVQIGNGTFVNKRRNEILINTFLSDLNIDITFLENLAQVRSAIECKVVELAIEKGSDSDWAEIEKMIQNADSEQTDDEVDSLDLQFEKKLATIADNEVLSNFQTMIHDLWLTAWGKLGIGPDDSINLRAEHLEILSYLKEKNIEKAISRMKEHVERGVN